MFLSYVSIDLDTSAHDAQIEMFMDKVKDYVKDDKEKASKVVDQLMEKYVDNNDNSKINDNNSNNSNSNNKNTHLRIGVSKMKSELADLQCHKLEYPEIQSVYKLLMIILKSFAKV